MEIAAQIGDSFFLVDDLLNIPNEEIGAPMADSSHQSTGASASLAETLSFNSWAGKSSLFDICLPCEELEELEWLSNFVEESFSSAAMDATMMKAVKESSSPTSVLSPKHGGLSLSKELMVVPGKARSKRARQGVCFWNTRILNDDAAALVECASSFSHDVEATDCCSGLEQQSFTDACSPVKKKAKSSHGSKLKEVWQGRRCLHCGIQKTPQWRAGPMGPKTLCNACGVRFKSGRLLPEYRPAASPSFLESMHSNSHRKVLELRRQKECEEMQEGKAEGAETEDEKKGEEEEQEDETGHDGSFILSRAVSEHSRVLDM